MQAFNDRTRGFVCGSLQVRVFDAEKEFAAGFPSEQPVEKGRTRSAYVQVTGR
jgi:hypothetical protein